ncbi:MAG: FkbM family methyltransferase [Pseudomonadota bacterium]
MKLQINSGSQGVPVSKSINDLEAFGAFAPTGSTRALVLMAQHTPLGRGKLRKYAADVLRDRHQGPLDTRLFGLNARLQLQNNSSETKALLKPSLYSKTATKLFRAMLPSAGAVIVDVGANAGLFSLLAASKFETGHLIAIEPQPVLFARLSDHMKSLNPSLSDRLEISLFNCAVGSATGAQILSVPRQLGQASLRTLPDAAELEVSVRPLADILMSSEIQHIDVLKVDVEGFEDEVMIPFLETARRALWPRAILLEHCHADRWQRDCRAYLLERGYVIRSADRTDTALIRSAE